MKKITIKQPWATLIREDYKNMNSELRKQNTEVQY